MVILTDKKDLQVRRKPLQKRSLQRISKILEVTSTLLEKLGVDGLTTIRIAEATGISVGSLYHYFPNKQAILHALGENWIDKIDSNFTVLQGLPFENMSLDQLVARVVDSQHKMYVEQKGILHLIQALFSIPDLQHLDDEHDELVIQHMMKMFSAISNHGLETNELERIARAYHELTHALMLTVALQTPERAARTLNDTKRSAISLLQPYLSNT